MNPVKNCFYFCPRWLCLPIILLCCSLGTRAQVLNAAPASVPQPAADVIVFANGDQLTGQLQQVSDGDVYFKNDAAGKLKIPWIQVKELRSVGPFAVIRTQDKVRRGRANADVAVGPFLATAQQVTVHTAKGDQIIPIANVAYMVQGADFTNAVEHSPGPLHGWAGSITGGAGWVHSTQDVTTYNAAIALTHSTPSVTWLPPDHRTQLGFDSTYGKISQPNTPTVKTSIFHALAEQDKYFSTRFYVLAHMLFDHNYAQGLDLQQTYGGGFGFSAIKQTQQTLDFTATVDYTKQQFQIASSNQNLIGSTFADNYMYKLPHSVVLTEIASISPEWSNMNAYSANAAMGLAIPLLKKFSFSAEAMDSYLNNPPPGFKANSIQLNTGITYTLP